MKLLDILKEVGGGILKSVIPGSGIIGAVNNILGGKKLANTATGDDVSRAIAELPAEDRATILNREFDVKIEKLKTLQVMLTADATTKHTTRPYIAKHSFHVIAFAIVGPISIWCYAVFTANTIMAKSIIDGWPFVLAAIGPLVYLLHAYFGILKSEQKNKLDASNGVSHAEGLGAFIGNIFKR